MKHYAKTLVIPFLMLAPFAVPRAHADIHIGIGLVPPPVYYGPPPAYYSPPPPVYYGPGVVYGQGGWNYGGDDDEDGSWRGRGWAHDRWHGEGGWGGWRGGDRGWHHDD